MTSFVTGAPAFVLYIYAAKQGGNIEQATKNHKVTEISMKLALEEIRVSWHVG